MQVDSIIYGFLRSIVGGLIGTLQYQAGLVTSIIVVRRSILPSIGHSIEIALVGIGSSTPCVGTKERISRDSTSANDVLVAIGSARQIGTSRIGSSAVCTGYCSIGQSSSLALIERGVSLKVSCGIILTTGGINLVVELLRHINEEHLSKCELRTGYGRTYVVELRGNAVQRDARQHVVYSHISSKQATAACHSTFTIHG